MGGLVAADDNVPCPSWSYFGYNGPTYWGTLCHKYEACSFGKHQSPINIDTDHVVVDPTLQPIEFDYKSLEELNITNDDAESREIQRRHGIEQLFENNGHTVEMVWGRKADRIRLGPLQDFDEWFHLVQFHFHSPSENFFHGFEYPMEIHMVHQSEAGHLAVLAVFFEEDEVGHDDFLRTLATNLPTVNEEFEVEAPDLKKFMQDSFRDGYYYFEGSLTTPPCTEGVHWIVARRVLPATYEELQLFRFTLIDNHRPRQALNDRVIREFIPLEQQKIVSQVVLGLSFLGAFVWLAVIVAAILYFKLHRDM